MTTTTEQITFVRLFGDDQEKRYLKQHGRVYVCDHCKEAHSPTVTPVMCATVNR